MNRIQQLRAMMGSGSGSDGRGAAADADDDIGLPFGSGTTVLEHEEEEDDENGFLHIANGREEEETIDFASAVSQTQQDGDLEEGQRTPAITRRGTSVGFAGASVMNQPSPTTPDQRQSPTGGRLTPTGGRLTPGDANAVGGAGLGAHGNANARHMAPAGGGHS